MIIFDFWVGVGEVGLGVCISLFCGVFSLCSFFFFSFLLHWNTSSEMGVYWDVGYERRHIEEVKLFIIHCI